MRIDRAWMTRIGRGAAALLLLGLTAQADMSEPFGLATVAAPQGPLWVTWRKLQAEIKAERPVIAQCRATPLECGSTPALQFIAIVDQGEGFAGLARIGHINRAANFALRAVGNVTPGAVHDKWKSPLAALTAGAGNCKQYAVLKYAALEDAGFAADDLRIVILQSRSRQQAHAVVAVRDDGHWLILDNRSLALVESRDLRDSYLPLYMLDQRGVRQFVRQPRVAQKFGAACAG
jgi:predicted transglutaminase-like cysteine proteinase